MKIAKRQTAQAEEWFDFISTLGLLDISTARELLLGSEIETIADGFSKNVFLAGKAKVLSVEGNIVGAQLLLSEALTLAENSNSTRGYPVSDDALSYVNLEFGVFWEKYGESFRAF